MMPKQRFSKDSSWIKLKDVRKKGNKQEEGLDAS